MGNPILDFALVLTIAAFAAVISGAVGSAVAPPAAKAGAERNSWLTRMALARSATTRSAGGWRWSPLALLSAEDASKRTFGVLEVAARPHEGDYVEILVRNLKTGKCRTFLAAAKRGKVSFALAQAMPEYAACPAAGEAVVLSLWRKRTLAASFGFDSFAWGLAEIQKRLEELRRDAERERRAEARRQGAQSGRKRQARSADADTRAVVDALNAIPAGSFRKQAASVAQDAWRASGAPAVKAARIAAAKLLHPDRIADKDRAAGAARVLAAINAKLDKRARTA